MIEVLRIKLVKSLIGRLPAHRLCAAGLGLKKLNQIVEIQDTPQNRGMIAKISYLLKYEG